MTGNDTDSKASKADREYDGTQYGGYMDEYGHRSYLLSGDKLTLDRIAAALDSAESEAAGYVPIKQAARLIQVVVMRSIINGIRDGIIPAAYMRAIVRSMSPIASNAQDGPTTSDVDTGGTPAFGL